MFNTLLDLKFRNYDKNLEFYSFLVIDYNNELRYLKESRDKLEDVSKMPPYIQIDFFKYNSKELTLNEFDKFLSDSWINEEVTSDDVEIKIKEIKRELKLKLIL